jgi:hypothetical protein
MHGASAIAGLVIAALHTLAIPEPQQPAEPLPPLLPGPPPFELLWNVPSGCPNADWLRDNVERHLSVTGGNERQSVAVEGRIRENEDNDWALDLAITDARGSGSRRLEAATCEELAEAAALIVAISIDPRLAEPEPPVDDAKPTEPEPEEPPQEASPAPWDNPLEPVPLERETAEPGPELRLGLRALGGIDVNVLSSIGPTLGLGFGVMWPRWRLDLTGIYWTPTEAAAEDLDDVGGVFQLWAFGLRGARVLHAHAFEFPLAVGLELGAMHGRGQGEGLRSDQAAAFWGAALAGAGVAWEVTRLLALWLQFDGILAMSRPEFETDQGTLVYRSSAGGARLMAGVEARWR